MKTEKRDKRSRILLISIITGLFLLNGWLIVSLINKDKRLDDSTEKNVVLSEEKERLSEMLNDAEEELEEYRGETERLDSIVDERDRVIANKVAQIRALLRGDRLTKNQLRDAENKIRNLNGEIATYKAQLDSLRTKNEFLQEEVRTKDDELVNRAERIDELETDYDKAMEKVRIASRLEALNLIATGIRFNWQDKEKETSRLSRADKVRVTFKLDNNETATKGSKTVYLKLITPSKATLHNDEMGSGTFTYQGEESLYTAKQRFNFNNENEELAFYWDKSPSMIAGDYEAYLFCEDHIIGKTQFRLK